jgi:hypothetical protein
MAEAESQSDTSWHLPNFEPETSSELHDAELSSLPVAILCDACTTVTSPSQCRESGDESPRRFPASWSTIQRNAMERTCAICYHFVQGMPPSLRSSIREDTDILYDWILFAIADRVSLNFDIGQSKGQQGESICIDFDPIEGRYIFRRTYSIPLHTPSSVALN